MLWTLEGAGLRAAAALTAVLVVSSVVYASWVLVRSSRRLRARRGYGWVPRSIVCHAP
jgi:hypothetical protein